MAARGRKVRTGSVPQAKARSPESPARSISFEVAGIPVPQGSPRAFSAGGRARLAIDSPKLKRWRETVAKVARFEMRGRDAIDEPVSVVATFIFPRPKSSKRDERWKDTKPDLDKLCRALGDSLQDARVLVDDSRIARWECTKRYGERPGVRVIVAPLSGFRFTGWGDPAREEVTP
jgi:Holliday junction resolvase RusA-like endonuclease